MSPHALQRKVLLRACEMLRLEAPPMWLDGDAPNEYLKKRERVLRAEAEGKFPAIRAKEKLEARRARLEAESERLKYGRRKVPALRALAERRGDDAAAAAAEELERRRQNAAGERKNVVESARRGEEWRWIN